MNRLARFATGCFGKGHPGVAGELDSVLSPPYGAR